MKKEWDNFSFPKGKDFGGVYFYMGYNINNPDSIGVYIGKASLNRMIGHRLYSHFFGMDMQRDNEQRLLRHDNYAIELITVIPIENRKQVFLAPALEEYLILNLKGKDIFKLNYIGNY